MFVWTKSIKMPEPNPIVEVYNDIDIRQSNKFHLRMGPILYKILLMESERTGLPISKILAYSSQPCDCCSNKEVTVIVKGKEIKVKRGILARHISSQSSGTSIINQHAKKQ